MSEYSITIKDTGTHAPQRKTGGTRETALSDRELLAIVLGSGTVNLSALDVANLLLVQYGGVRALKEVSLEELTQIKGIGQAKAVSIKAAVELGVRIARDVQDKILIKSPEDVKNLVMEEMRFFDREHFRAIYLDRKGGVLAVEDISVGGLHSSIVHPREVFKSAVKRSAASLILVHNHPSGDPTPSSEDIEVTRRLIEAGTIMGIEVLDHVVIGEKRYCSLKSAGLI